MNAEVSSSVGSEKSPVNKKTSWLMLVAIGLPMIMAYVVFSTGFAMPTGTINKGDLLLPATPLAELTITDRQGDAVDLLSGKKKWRWLIVGNNSCQQACQNNLYLSRQVHIRLGEKALRLERLYLNTDSVYSDALASELKEGHPRLVMAHIDSAQWKKVMSETNAKAFALNGENLYVVDQQGFVMMTYNPSHQGSDLLDDIKRLLKYSYED